MIGAAAMTILLREGLSFCHLGDRIVFLDLPADRYFCLTPPAQAAFSRACTGAALSRADSDVLRDAGIADHSPRGLPLAQCPRPAPRRSGYDQRPARGAPLAIARLLFDLACARISLRCLGLAETLATVARSKPQIPCEVADEGDVARIARAYRTCARLVGSHEQCLPHAIAVARSLHAAGAAADLVIGVAMPPFRAHAWVQWHDLLVNERLEIAAHYTPIRIV